MITEAGKEVHSIEEIRNNTVIGHFDTETVKINFRGTGNLLYVEDGCRLGGCRLNFNGDNALIYLSANTKHACIFNIDAWHGTAVFLGKDNYFNGVMNIIASERKNIIIGNDCVFSFGIWLRTADPHIIYSIETKKRLNLSKSIWIGDHVWIGQNVTLLKGNIIGSGSILSAGAVLSNKRVESNSVYAGNPARKIKEGIFFSKKSVHSYSYKDTKESMQYEGDEYIYTAGEEVSIEDIDHRLSKAGGSREKLEIIQTMIANNQSKGRFFLAPKKTENVQKSSATLFSGFKKK